MDAESSSLAGKPAAYGYSCSNCVQSKRKCIVEAAGGACQRCRKTNKECTPAKTVRRRGVTKKTPAVSETSRLEAKIDSLVSLMKSGGQTDISISKIINSAESSSRPSPEGGSSWSCSGDQNNKSTPATTDSTGSLNMSSISSLEAEECLNHFRTFKLPYFPFVHIPFEKSAAQLHTERPFLLLCIMAISSKSTARQYDLGLKIRETVAQEMVVHSDHNIDLLLGLLTVIGWASYHYHQFHPKPFLSVFTHLALSIVLDMGLNKPAHAKPSTFNLRDLPPSTAPRTLEERRAALGCYFMTSIVSSFLQKIETLRWTPHLEESLQILDSQKQCANDETLVNLIRIRCVVEKYRSRRANLNDPSEATGLTEEEAALFSSVKEDIFKSSPKDVVLLHLYSDELEIAVSSLSFTPSDLKTSRQDHLFQVLTSINSWFNILFMIPPAGYLSFPFSIFSQFSRCLLSLYRLACLDSPDWDKSHVHKTGNPISIIDRLVNTLEKVPVIAGIDNTNFPNGDLFSRSAQILRSIRPEWEAKLGPDNPVSLDPSSNDADGFNMPDTSLFGDDILYNGWFMELMSSTF